MPSGVAGSITRALDTSVESVFLNSLKPVLAFGAPVKLVAGKAEPFEAGDTAVKFYGILSRVAPSVSGSTAQLFTDGVPNVTSAQGVAVRGYINVACTIGTPVRGGIVYVRIVAATGKAIGDLEATADGVNNVALTDAVWAVDGKDGANNTEIRIKA
jgi:tetrahydromethanopterin S-methyltransferase subunit H